MANPQFIPILTPQSGGTFQQVLVEAISTTSGSAADGGKVVLTDPTTGQIDASMVTGAGSTPFNGVLSGTNSNALVIGSGGSLTVSGTGVINASAISGVNISGTPSTAGQVLTAMPVGSPAILEASWQTPPLIVISGADPTGAVDSTTAIQNALNSVPAGGGTVIFPVVGGTYRVNSQITISTSGTVFVFNGATLVCYMNASAILILPTVTDVTLINPIGQPAVVNGIYPFIEDNGQSLRISGLTGATGISGGTFGYYVQLDNDQAFRMDGANFNVPNVIRADSTFVGCGIYSVGGAPNAAVGWITGSNISMAGKGNGIDWQGGNDLYIAGSVIQAFSQWGLRMWGGTLGGGSGNAYLIGVHIEQGVVINPWGNVGSAGVILLQQASLYRTTGQIGGKLPTYTVNGTPGTNIYHYWLQLVDASGNVSNVMPVGIVTNGNTTINGTNSVNVVLPSVPDATSATLFRINVTANGSTFPVVATAIQVASGLTVNIGNITTYTDSVTTPSTVTPHLGPNTLWFPRLPFWPGDLILGGNSDTNSNSMSVYYGPLTINSTIIQAGLTLPRSSVNILPGQLSYTSNPFPIPIFEYNTIGVVLNPNNDPSALLMPYHQNFGATGEQLKGMINFGLSQPRSGGDILTLADQTPYATIADLKHRPNANAGDSAISLDGSGGGYGVSLRDATQISSYINTLADGTSWLERLTSSLKTLKVPLNLQSLTASELVATDASKTLVSVPAPQTFAPITAGSPPVASEFLTGYSASTGLFTAAQVTYADILGTPNLSVYALISSLATVATTGSYTDLINKPQLAQTFAVVSGGSPAEPIEFLTGYSASTGLFSASQIYYADIIGTPPAETWAGLTGVLTNGQVIPYTDAGISRLGAASLALGNGTAGSFSGKLKLTEVDMVAGTQGGPGSGAAFANFSLTNNDDSYSSQITCNRGYASTPLGKGSIIVRWAGNAYSTLGANYQPCAYMDIQAGAAPNLFSTGCPGRLVFTALNGIGSYGIYTVMFGGAQVDSASGPGFMLGASVPLLWNHNDNVTGDTVADTSLSRISAGVVAVGTGAAGSKAGTIWANTLKIGSNGLTITQNPSFASQLVSSSTFTVNPGVFAVGGNAIGTSNATFYSTAVGNLAIEIVGFAGQTGNLIQAIASNGVSVFAISPNGSLLWGSGAGDTNLSRIGAASLVIGNGTVGDFSGALKLTNLSVQGTLTDGFASVGTAGQVLTSTGTKIAWATPSSGFSNPMTTLGDIIIEGNSGSPATLGPVRLGIGTTGQVLTVVGGVPAWATAGGGGGAPAGGAIITGMPLGMFTNNSSWSNYTIYSFMAGCDLLNIPANTWKVVLLFTGGTGAHIAKFNIVRTARYSLVVVDRTQVKFGGNMPATITWGGSPTAAAPQIQESDAISLALDQNHDYYIEIYFDADGTYNGTVGFAQGGAVTTYGRLVASYDNIGDLTTTTSMTSPFSFSGNGLLVGQVYVAS